MKLRCNTIVDCPFDEADETECSKVLFTETYNRYASPNTAVTINGQYNVAKVITYFKIKDSEMIFPLGKS